MKFSVNNKIMKEVIDKVMAIAKEEKCANIPYPLIKFEAIDNQLSLSTYNYGISMLKIKVDAKIIEGGSFCIDIETAEVICNVKDWITVESFDRYVKVYNSKKQSKLVTTDIKEYIFDIPKLTQVEKIMNNVELNNFIADLKMLEKARATDKIKPILTGFNFNSEIGISTVSNYMAIIRKISFDNIKPFDITVNGKVLKELSKIVNKKSNQTAEVLFGVCDDKKYIVFKNDEFEYYTSIIKGEFFNIKKLIDGQTNPVAKAEFSFNDNTEVINTLKEYIKICKTDKKNALVVFGNENKINFYAKSTKYQTIDELETVAARNIDNVMFGVNPSLLSEVLGIFSGDYNISYYGALSPLLFTSDSWQSVLLPVRLKDNMSKDDILNQI